MRWNLRTTGWEVCLARTICAVVQIQPPFPPGQGLGPGTVHLEVLSPPGQAKKDPTGGLWIWSCCPGVQYQGELGRAPAVCLSSWPLPCPLLCLVFNFISYWMNGRWPKHLCSQHWAGYTHLYLSHKSDSWIREKWNQLRLTLNFSSPGGNYEASWASGHHISDMPLTTGYVLNKAHSPWYLIFSHLLFTPYSVFLILGAAMDILISFSSL